MAKKLAGKVALSPADRAALVPQPPAPLPMKGHVAISYVASPDKADAVVKELKAKGVEARAFKADQASSTEVEQLVKEVAKTFGRLDILVNNAGVAVSGAVDDANADTAALAARTPSTCTASSLRSVRLETDGRRRPDRHHRFGHCHPCLVPGLADYAATKAAIVATARARRATSDRVASPSTCCSRLDRHRHEPKEAASSPKPSDAARLANVLAPPKRSPSASCSYQPRSVVRDRHRTQCDGGFGA